MERKERETGGGEEEKKTCREKLVEGNKIKACSGKKRKPCSVERGNL